MLRIALVSNELPPYRIPFFESLARTIGVDFQAIFCSRREPNRNWELPPLHFNHVFLRERIIERNGRYIHNNPDIIAALDRFMPDVIVTGGFNPTHLYAFGYALAKGVAHVPLTDGTDVSEQRLGALHRTIRRFVYARSRAFVSASAGGQKLYANYGIAAESCFKSCLCIDNQAFAPPASDLPKQFDFIFCGRIEAVKNPLFALDVARETARKLGRKVRILFVGSGVQEEELKRAASLQSELVDADFQGFMAHQDLPRLYHASRLFLFPTLWDPWGVVVNEACAAGLPVIISPQAGAAGELVRDGENGFVTDLDVGQWAHYAALLLQHESMWHAFSARSQFLVRKYTYDNAAAGLVEACRFSVSNNGPTKIRRTQRGGNSLPHQS